MRFKYHSPTDTQRFSNVHLRFETSKKRCLNVETTSCSCWVYFHRYFLVLDTTASHNRMKLCEAIIRSCHICGEMLPPYKEILMTSFACGVKDEDDLIRASALSGIGDLCYLLKFSLSGMIEEVCLPLFYCYLNRTKFCFFWLNSRNQIHAMTLGVIFSLQNYTICNVEIFTENLFLHYICKN